MYLPKSFLPTYFGGRKAVLADVSQYDGDDKMAKPKQWVRCLNV